MRAALHLFLMTCVFWCALGLAEPGAAHGPTEPQPAALADTAAGDPAGDGAADTAGQAHHHHCPLAPDVRPHALADGPAFVRASAIAPRADPLASLSRAPPLQPPSA